MSGPGGIYVPGLVDPFMDGGVAGRRGGVRAAGGGAAARTAYHGLYTGNARYFSGVSGQAPTLTAGSSTVGFLVRKVSAGNLLRDKPIASAFTTATRGYRNTVRDGSNARTLMLVHESGGTTRQNQQTHTLQQNKIHRLVHVFATNASNYELRVYLDGAHVATTTYLASAGYAPPTTEPLIVGQDTAGETDELDIMALIVANATATSAVAVAAWDAQVKAGGSLLLPAGTTHLWDASAAIVGGSGTWTDSVTGRVLSETGIVVKKSITVASGDWA